MTGPEPDDTTPATPSGSGSDGWPSYQPPSDPGSPTEAGPGEPEWGQGWGQPAPNPSGTPQPPSPQQPPSQQQPYGGAAYGQQPQGTYPAYPGGHPGYGAYAPTPNQPQATTAMVLGIVSLVGGLLLCGFPLLLGPVAAVMGYHSRKQIAASNGALGGEGAATAGFVMGIIASVLLVLGILLFVMIVGLSSV